MKGRTPREATDAFLDPLRGVVACITSEGFVARGARPGGPYQATFQRGVAILVRRPGLRPIRFHVAYRYSVVQDAGARSPWQIVLTDWIHSIVDADGAPIAAFHWHPAESGRVTWPHLHAYGQHASVELHKLHLPTGPLSIASVVRFLIEDLDVLPRRASWEQILERHERAFGGADT